MSFRHLVMVVVGLAFGAVLTVSMQAGAYTEGEQFVYPNAETLGTDGGTITGDLTSSGNIILDNGTSTSPEYRLSNGSDTDHSGWKLISGGFLFYTDNGTMTFQADVDGGSNAGYVFKHGSKSTGGGTKLMEFYEDGHLTYESIDMQGNALIMDDDGDASIYSPGDDQITFSFPVNPFAVTFADGAVTMNSHLQMSGGKSLYMNGLSLRLDADDDSYFDEAADDNIILYLGGGTEVDFGQTRTQFNNTVRVTSSGPALLNETSTDTNPVIVADASDDDTGIGDAGAGTMSLIVDADEAVRLGSGAVRVKGNRLFQLSDEGSSVGTAPSEPGSCSATNPGAMVYADDTNDSGAGAVCVCIATSDNGAGTPSGYDWRRMDDHSTACPFF